jgi:hypothetical protein
MSGTATMPEPTAIAIVVASRVEAVLDRRVPAGMAGGGEQDGGENQRIHRESASGGA